MVEVFETQLAAWVFGGAGLLAVVFPGLEATGTMGRGLLP